MRISELTTDRAADILCELTPHIANITSDKALLDALKEKIGTDKKSVAEIYVHGAKKLSVIVPILLKDHKHDIFSILAILQSTTEDEIAKQGILDTMTQIKEAWEDKDLIDFFKSWQQGAGKE